MLLYTQNSSGKKRKKTKPTKKLILARQEHESFLQSIKSPKTKSRHVNSFPDLSVKQVAPTSDNLYTNGGFKRTVDDWKWKKDREETAETIKEIERKKKRTAPIWNKGGYQYITDGEDVKTLGRKV
jgi:hypothetical protein